MRLAVGIEPLFTALVVQYLTLSHLGDLKRSMPGDGFHRPCLSLLLLEIWQPNLAQRLSII